MYSTSKFLISLFFFSIIFIACNNEDAEVTESLEDQNEVPLGPAPNERTPGSFRFNNSNFREQTNATSCNPSSKDNNAYFMSMRSTVLFNGNVGTGTVQIVLPENNIRSMEYELVASNPIDLQGKPNNAIISFFLNTSAPGGGGENISGYAAEGKLWVDASNDNIIARFEDVELKGKKDGGGKVIGKLSGAIKCSDG